MGEKRITIGTNCPLQLTRVRAYQWTEAKRRRFLDALATSCNVKASARSVGMSDKGAYGLRRRDAGFSAAWGEAMQIGFARLEEMLMEHALAAAERLVAEGPGSVVEDGGEDGAKDGAEAADDRPSQPLTADEIKLFMFLLSRHAANLKNPRVIGAKAHHATREETNAALKRKLDSLDRRLKAVT